MWALWCSVHVCVFVESLSKIRSGHRPTCAFHKWFLAYVSARMKQCFSLENVSVCGFMTLYIMNRGAFILHHKNGDKAALNGVASVGFPFSVQWYSSLSLLFLICGTQKGEILKNVLATLFKILKPAQKVQKWEIIQIN